MENISLSELQVIITFSDVRLKMNRDIKVYET